MMGLDYNSSSIGIDFGTTASGVKKIQVIPDGKFAVHRVTQRALDLYTSSDNSTYTIIPRSNWTFVTDSKGIITITLNERIATRYLKVHVKFDDRDSYFSPKSKATFLNDFAKMLRIYQEAASRTEDFQYDPDGNRKYQRITLIQSKDYTSSYYANSDRLKTDGKYAFVYDDAGNLVQKGNSFTINGDIVTFIATSGDGVEYWQYTYDLLNRLTEVSKNGTVVADYEYSPDGLREVKRGNSGTIHYVFEGTEPIFEKRISDGKIKSYVYALGKHLARIDGVIGDQAAKVYYYHTDNVGSVKAVTDQSGKVVYNADYFAFGTQFSKDGDFDETHGFTGKEYDSDTGLCYYNARWYDSDTGRFISEDTNRGDINDPRTLNYYTYCFNNPLIYADITGNTPFVITVSKDTYMYGCNGRLNDIFRSVTGYIPLSGTIWDLSDRSAGVKAITEKSFANAAKSLASKVTEYASVLSDFKDSKVLSSIGKAAGVVGNILTTLDVAQTLTNKSYITDQIIQSTVGYYLSSSSEKGVEEKYAYAVARVEQLVKDGKITYKTDLFGNVTDVKVDKETKEQLGNEFMLIDSARVNSGEETKDQYYSNYAGVNDPAIVQGLVEDSSTKSTSSNQSTESTKQTGTTGSQGTNDGKDGNGTTTTSTKIICAELFKQGLMDRAIFEADEAFGEMLHDKYPIILKGYHAWAKPVVYYMKKSKTFTHFVYVIVKPWSFEMAHIMGKRMQGDVVGKILMYVGFVVCLLIGWMITFPFNVITLVIILIGIILLKQYRHTKNVNSRLRHTGC